MYRCGSCLQLLPRLSSIIRVPLCLSGLPRSQALTALPVDAEQVFVLTETLRKLRMTQYLAVLAEFLQGMFDEQLLRLTEVLKKGRIWALNAGENFEISLQAWETFTKELQHTAVAYMYVSEHHLARTALKKRMQDAIRENRR